MTPERKLLSQVLALLVLAIGAGLLVWKTVYQAGELEAQQKEHDARLFAPQKVAEKLTDGGSPAAQFTKISIHAKGTTTVLERTPPGPWRMTSPAKAAVDPLAIDAVVSQLQQSKFKSTVEEAPDQKALEKYGLTAPSFSVEASAQVGGETRTVKLVGGIENTFDGSIYMRRNDEPQVYAAEGGVRLTFDKAPFDLRDKNLLKVDEAQSQAVALTSKANHWKLERGADKQWRLTEPDAGLADGTAVKAMFGTVASERAQAFPDDTPANRTAFGLDAPTVDATMTLKDGGTVRLRFGKEEGPDGGVATWYALRDDADGAVLAKVSATAAGSLDRATVDLRDKSIIPFNNNLVTRVVFHNADGTEVVVAKPAADAGVEQWAVAAPEAGKAKIFKVTSALWVLGALKASQVVEPDAKNAKKYGLGPQARSVTLYGPDPKTQLARLTIGSPVPDRPNSFYATGTRGEVVMVDGSRFGELPTKLSDVLDVPDAGAFVFRPLDAGAAP